MINHDEILSILQHGDSFFPSGAVSFSWGSETLIEEQIIKSKDDVEAFVINQLTQRWQYFDRIVIVSAYCQCDKFNELEKLDNYVETLMLNKEFREASKQLGTAMLSTHESLGNNIASEYLNRVYQGTACGHQNITQALIWKSIKLSLDSIQYISAYNLSVNILSATLRLAKLGHIESQAILKRLHSTIIKTISKDGPDINGIKAYTPCTDIASMRHEVSNSRLFIN